MTLPTGPLAGDLGARTWEAPDPSGPPATPRSQVAAAAVAVSALVLGGLAAPEVLGWFVADAVALVVAIVVGLALPPLPPLRKLSGLVLGLIVGGLAMVGTMFLWAAAGLAIPPGLVPLVALVAVGLDWRRADRLRTVVTASGAVVLLAALSKDPVVVVGAVAWLALAFGTYTLLEGDRRAALPRVQPDARAAAAEARPDDLATTLLIAAAVALLAALVLSVPSCQRRMSGDAGGSGAGSSAGEAGAGGGSGSGFGSGSGRYVPDPDGRFLIPGEGTPGSGGERIPTPDQVPDGLEPGAPRTETLPDGTQLTYEERPDGDVAVTVTDPDGTTTDWRFHERSDGLVEIDRLEPDGTTAERWFFDPEGELATQEDGATGGPTPTPEPEPDASDRPDARAILQVLGILVALGLLAWLGAWWWRRRHPGGPAPDPTVPPWALALAARIDAEGAARGRARAADESVVRYGRELAAGALPDARLAVVCEVVSDALFSAVDPGPSVASWATSTFDEILAAHPVPSKRDRHREEQPAAR